MADDALTAALTEAHNWHAVAGVNEPRQGITQTVPEPLVLCLSCGWMRSHEYAEHLATEVAQVVREHTAAQVAAAKAEAWAACVLEAEDLGWMHDLAADDMAGRNPYTTEEQR